MCVADKGQLIFCQQCFSLIRAKLREKGRAVLCNMTFEHSQSHVWYNCCSVCLLLCMTNQGDVDSECLRTRPMGCSVQWISTSRTLPFWTSWPCDCQDKTGESPAKFPSIKLSSGILYITPQFNRISQSANSIMSV